MKLICYPSNSSIKVIRTNEAPPNDLCYSTAIFFNFRIITQRLLFQSLTRGGLKMRKTATGKTALVGTALKLMRLTTSTNSFYIR